MAWIDLEDSYDPKVTVYLLIKDLKDISQNYYEIGKTDEPF